MQSLKRSVHRMARKSLMNPAAYFSFLILSGMCICYIHDQLVGKQTHKSSQWKPISNINIMDSFQNIVGRNFQRTIESISQADLINSSQNEISELFNSAIKNEIWESQRNLSEPAKFETIKVDLGLDRVIQSFSIGEQIQPYI